MNTFKFHWDKLIVLTPNLKLFAFVLASGIGAAVFVLAATMLPLANLWFILVVTVPVIVGLYFGVKRSMKNRFKKFKEETLCGFLSENHGNLNFTSKGLNKLLTGESITLDIDGHNYVYLIAVDMEKRNALLVNTDPNPEPNHRLDPNKVPYLLRVGEEYTSRANWSYRNSMST